jgi:hypothetical protein
MALSQSQEIRLPVLDVTTADTETAKELVEAISKYGFVFIKNNHNEIPPPVIEEMFGLVWRNILSDSLFL